MRPENSDNPAYSKQPRSRKIFWGEGAIPLLHKHLPIEPKPTENFMDFPGNTLFLYPMLPAIRIKPYSTPEEDCFLIVISRFHFL